MYALKLVGGLVVFFILLAACSAWVATPDPPSVQEPTATAAIGSVEVPPTSNPFDAF